MSTEIRMPQLSDTMHAGKILTWRKKEGEKVTRGDILAEVETDKANLEIESFFSGTLLKIMVPAESTAKVGDVIAYVGEAGESVPAEGAAAKSAASPAPQGEKPSAPASEKQPSDSGLNGAQAGEPSHAEASESSGRIKASPLARKVAQQRNIDLSTVRGSGPQGRIIRSDLDRAGTAQPAREAAQPRAAAPQAPRPAAAQPPPPAGGRLTPFSRMRETIARRMQESVREAPHFYTTVSIDMGQAVRLREILKAKQEYSGISLNHLVIRAAAYALEGEPRVNRAVRDGQVFEPGQINIGIITSVEDGLLIPVVKQANRLSLKDLVFEAKAAVERARAGRPSSADLTGGTFSISNMGMFDVENFTAIINPGQGAVLAVSSVKEEPVVEDGQIRIGKRMKCTLSVDHRIIDGVMAGTFLKLFKEGLEAPALLMAGSEGEE